LDPEPGFLTALTFITQLNSEFSFQILLIEICVIILGLAFSFIFSGAEVALFSIKGSELDQLNSLATHSSSHRNIKKMIENPRRLLSTILIGNTFANIVVSIVSAVITGQIAEIFHFPEFLIYVIEILVVTFMLVIISEITPKVIAIKNPLQTAVKLNHMIYGFYIVMTPVSILIAKSAHSIESKLPYKSHEISGEDILTIAEVGEEKGSLKGDEREIFENVVEFGQTAVKEIMTSRVDIVAVSLNDELGEVIDSILDRKLSRMPLYGDDLDDILGVINSKDLLPYLKTDFQNTAINWKTIARKVLFVPTTKRLDDLLKEFKKEKTHMAIVVDEWGGTEGIVTLDDVLAEIIGNIGDETTNPEQLYERVSENSFSFDAKINVEDAEKVLEMELSGENDEYETLAGLVYHILERIPENDEKLYFKDVEITVLEVENNRIKKVLISKNLPL
jgi:putative hemolysin